MEEKKPKGQCSYCKSIMQPTILKVAKLKRDTCICSVKTCGQKIISCRIPGCDNYARCGTRWDDELCQACTKKTMGRATKLGYYCLTIAVSMAIRHKIKNHFDNK